VLNELADSQDLSRRSKLLLDRIIRCDGGLGLVGAIQIPSVEAREVLQGTEDFITTDYERMSECGSHVRYNSTVLAPFSTLLVVRNKAKEQAKEYDETRYVPVVATKRR
jgi:hypothetical protein